MGRSIGITVGFKYGDNRSVGPSGAGSCDRRLNEDPALAGGVFPYQPSAAPPMKAPSIAPVKTPLANPWSV